MNYLMQITIRDHNGVAETIDISWEVIVMAYDIDLRSDCHEKPIATKLTEEHLNIGGMNEMRVKHALQVFSNTVADGIDTLANRKGV